MTSTEPAAPAPARPGFWSRLAFAIHRFFVRLCLLLGPIVVTGLALAALWLWKGEEYTRLVAMAGGASLFGLGTTVVLGKLVLDNQEWMTLSTWELAYTVMWVNAASGFWYAYNIDLLERLPRIGPSLQRMRQQAVHTLGHRPWIRRLSTVGVGLFVISPMPGSGSLGGAIVGRLIGLSRIATFVTVALAGVVVCIAYAMLGEKLRPLVADVPTWVKASGAVAVFGVAFLFIRWMQRRAAAMPLPEEAQASAQAAGDASEALSAHE